MILFGRLERAPTITPLLLTYQPAFLVSNPLNQNYRDLTHRKTKTSLIYSNMDKEKKKREVNKVSLNQILHNYVLPNLGSILIFLVTVMLVLLTYLYLRSTRRMAKVMEAEFNIRTKPIVDIIFETPFLDMMETVVFSVKNKGSYALKLEQYQLDVTYKDPEDEFLFSIAQGVGQYINPTKKIECTQELDFSNTKLAERKDIKVIYIDATFSFLDVFDNKFKREMRVKVELVPTIIAGD